MASMSFDFNKMQRSFLTVILKDNRKILVKMPMKKTFEKMTSLEVVDTESMTANDAMDTLGSIVSEILSNNMQKETITTEYIVENYDTEEMTALIDKFMEFTGSTKNNPN